MKKKKKKANSQTIFRNKTFAFHQYWNITYTEKISNIDQQDFTVFIKAKSYELAKKILFEKVIEDNPNAKAVAMQGYMFHKDYMAHTKSKLTLKKWELIRSAAFPNVHNILYKYHRPRVAGKWNRWHFPSTHLKPYCYQKGHTSFTANKFKKGIIKDGKLLILDEWVDQKSFDFTEIKKAIIDALIANNNTRKKVAIQLNIDRTTLRRWMERIKDVDWNIEYPPPKPIPPIIPKEERSKTQKRVMLQRKNNGIPFFPKRVKCEQKRLSRLKISIEKKTDSYRRSLVPKIKEALSASGNVRIKAAKYLGVNPSTFKRWLSKTKYLVNWTHEYPPNLSPR